MFFSSVAAASGIWCLDSNVTSERTKITPCHKKAIRTTTTTMEETAWEENNGTTDPVWIDDAWLDTVVVMGITCFILCLMGLSKASDRGIQKIPLQPDPNHELESHLSPIGSYCKDGHDLWNHWYGSACYW